MDLQIAFFFFFTKRHLSLKKSTVDVRCGGGLNLWSSLLRRVRQEDLLGPSRRLAWATQGDSILKITGKKKKKELAVVIGYLPSFQQIAQQ